LLKKFFWVYAGSVIVTSSGGSNPVKPERGNPKRAEAMADRQTTTREHMQKQRFTVVIKSDYYVPMLSHRILFDQEEMWEYDVDDVEFPKNIDDLQTWAKDAVDNNLVELTGPFTILHNRWERKLEIARKGAEEPYPMAVEALAQKVNAIERELQASRRESEILKRDLEGARARALREDKAKLDVPRPRTLKNSLTGPALEEWLTDLTDYFESTCHEPARFLVTMPFLPMGTRRSLKIGRDEAIKAGTFQDNWDWVSTAIRANMQSSTPNQMAIESLTSRKFRTGCFTDHLQKVREDLLAMTQPPGDELKKFFLLNTIANETVRAHVNINPRTGLPWSGENFWEDLVQHCTLYYGGKQVDARGNFEAPALHPRPPNDAPR
jgi:hypothetical protein